MRLAVEKRLISSMEKEETRSNCRMRSLVAKQAPTLADKTTTTIMTRKLPNAAKSIPCPVVRMEFNVAPSVMTSSVTCFMYSGIFSSK